MGLWEWNAPLNQRQTHTVTVSHRESQTQPVSVSLRESVSELSLSLASEALGLRVRQWDSVSLRVTAWHWHSDSTWVTLERMSLRVRLESETVRALRLLRQWESQTGTGSGTGSGTVDWVTLWLTLSQWVAGHFVPCPLRNLPLRTTKNNRPTSSYHLYLPVRTTST